MPKNSEESNNTEKEDSKNENKDQLNSMKEILSFCPFCGVEIDWSEDLKFCIKCGNYIIPYIPRKKVSKWLGKKYFLSTAEIDELYSSKSRKFQQIPVISSRFIKKRILDWKAAFSLPLLAFFVQILVIVALVFVLLIISEGDSNFVFDFMLKPEFLIFGYFATFIFLIVPYLFIKRYLPRGASKSDKMRAIGVPTNIKNKKLLIEITIGIVFAIIMTFTVIIAEEISAYLTNLIYKVSIEETFESDLSNDLSSIGFLIVSVVFMFLSIGPSEEILFRGFSQKGFEQSLGKASGLIVTALYFTLFHIIAYILEPALFFYSFLPYFSVSLLLGLLFTWRRNVYASIFSHALYNSIQFIMGFFFPNYIVIIIWVLSIIIIIYLIFFIISKLRNRNVRVEHN